MLTGHGDGPWPNRTTNPRLLLPFLLHGLVAPLGAQTPEVIPLWQNGAPGFEARRDEPEQAKDWWVKNIHNPSLTVFRPPPGKANGCALVVAPGGGFRELVFTAEGKQVADFLNPLGVTVFVLKYRLPNEPDSPYTLEHVRQDARQAMSLVRNRAGEFQVDPDRIGLLGFSAGLAAVMMVAFDPGEGGPKAADPIDRAKAQPDFATLVYPGGKPQKKSPATRRRPFSFVRTTTNTAAPT